MNVILSNEINNLPVIIINVTFRFAYVHFSPVNSESDANFEIANVKNERVHH
jgi:hypothetical protein